MNSTYKITLTTEDSFNRFQVYEDASVLDLTQMLNRIAALGREDWDVETIPITSDPYSVILHINTKHRPSGIWGSYTIKIEDGDACV